MSYFVYLLAGFFLPLFPLSMAFNILFDRVRNPALRSAGLVACPQIGLALVLAVDADVPTFFVVWGLLTSLFYAFRALVLREVNLWTCFLGTSAWALLWLAAHNGTAGLTLHLYALGFSAPLVLLTLLSADLEQRFGAAYTGLYGGLALSMPRFAGVLVFVVLAIIATPLFPGFFAMLATIIYAVPASPTLAIGAGVVWLLWSWAGTRLLEGLIVGEAEAGETADLAVGATWVYAAVLGALVLGSMFWIGDLT